MSERSNDKRIPKRIIMIFGAFLAIIVILVFVIGTSKRYSWKNKFDLTYLGMWKNYYGEHIGDRYSIYNRTNNTYLISAIYITVNGKEIKLREHENIRPHEEVEIKIAYSTIDKELGEENAFYDIVIIGFEYEKK